MCASKRAAVDIPLDFTPSVAITNINKSHLALHGFMSLSHCWFQWSSLFREVIWKLLETRIKEKKSRQLIMAIVLPQITLLLWAIKTNLHSFNFISGGKKTPNFMVINTEKENQQECNLVTHALTNNHTDLRCLTFKYHPKINSEITIKTCLPKNETAFVYNLLWTKQPYWTARHLFRESCEKVRIFSFPSTMMENSNKTITGHLLNIQVI